MDLRLFDKWQGQLLDGIVAECWESVEDAFPTFGHWREVGGKVLGHFQVYFPEEIAHAARMQFRLSVSNFIPAAKRKLRRRERSIPAKFIFSLQSGG